MIGPAMEPFRFTTKLRTGLQALDRQHVEWFQALERLRKAVEQGGGEAGVPAALAFAVSYTQRHFAEEEQAMAAAGYAGLETHRRQHADLVTRLCELTAAHGDEEAVAVQVLELMSGWIESHIAGHDLAYVPHLTAHRDAAAAAG